MSRLRVSILDPNATKKTIVELPSDVDIHRLVQSLVRRMNYPSMGQDGNPITYRMTHIRDGEEVELESDRTLEQCGVQNDDTLRLYAEMRAG